MNLVVKNNKLIYDYGIDLIEYNRLFTEQNGCCAICKDHQTLFKKRLAVDHCHKTGKIRGLLCLKCNRAIGLLEDDPKRCEQAKEYLSQ